MKLNFYSFFLVLALVTFSALFLNCDKNKNGELENLDNKGLVLPGSSLVLYNPDSAGSTSIPVIVPKGPAIDYVIIYKQFSRKDINSTKYAILTRLDIGGANKDGDINTNVTATYADLSRNLFIFYGPMPSDESFLETGDRWYISFTAIMINGERIENEKETIVSVANFFTGQYNDHLILYDPTTGSYPDNIALDTTFKKDVIAYSDTSSTTSFGDWDNGQEIFVTVRKNNSVNVQAYGIGFGRGDPFNPLRQSHYDPSTGKIFIYYNYPDNVFENYPDSLGYYIYWETLTPAD